MDAIKFLLEKERMCKYYYGDGCPLCPAYPCEKMSVEHPDKLVEYVEKWAENNPRKTLLKDVLEKFPNIKLDSEGTPNYICPYELGYFDEAECNMKDCVKCWDREI